MTYLITQILLCLIVAFLLGLLLGWWLWSRGCREKLDALAAEWQARMDRAESEWKSRLAKLEAELAAFRRKAEPDDLTKIEGIGPKIQELLFAAGIYSFGDLAAVDVDRLREILNAAGERFQMHEPKTWPEQADLAAKGKWAELAALQELLRGGRED
jgi:predicted flap endonuclease-1-like 5' DNA nuclease